jgi:transcriptional regulator with XRE-family HTH domain
MSWSEYISLVAPRGQQKDIAAAAGVDGSTVSRWRSGLAPKPENVAAFARAYDRPVLEAFVAAGFLTEEEAGQQPVGRPRLSELSTDELLHEIRERIIVYPADPYVDYAEDITKRPRLPRR